MLYDIGLNTGSVSYTHLDVYKRQLMDIADVLEIPIKDLFDFR